MTAWQPIETAPLDGTAVLLYGAECVMVGRWLDLDPNERGWVDPHSFAPSSPDPTHWMPLPEKPE